MLKRIMTGLLCVCALINASARAAELRGGASAVDITPLRLPVSMTGSFQDRQATGVHDRLHARCLILDDGTTRIAFVICDSCLISREIFDRAKEAASKATGIPVPCILTAATHTHTAPTSVPLAQCHPDPAYVVHLTKQIAQSIVTANRDLKPVEAGWGRVAVPEEINNRRWFVKPQAMRPNPFGRTNDKVRMNPPRGTGLLIRPAGPADAAVSFLSVRTPKGKPVAVLANYGLHYVGGIPGGQLSADYFGEFARQVGKRLDGDSSFVGIMSNGASGDVNNYQFLEPRPRAEPFVRVRAVAARVADRVAAQHNKVAFQTGATIRMSEQELELGVRQPDSDDLKYAQELLAKAANPERLTTDQVYAQETVRLSKAAPTVRIRLQAISIGELAIVAIPCEVFAEIGLELKRRSPFPMTFVIALANGYNGYLPTPGQHELGGYETWRSGWSYLETQASTKITDNLIGQLNAFRKAPDASSKSGTSD